MAKHSRTNKRIREEKFDFDLYFPPSSLVGPLKPEQQETLDFLRSKMIVEQDKDKWQYAYNFMQFANPYHVIEGTREYIFFTKPDLNILSLHSDALNPVLSKNSFWNEMFINYRDDIACLQKKVKRSGNAIDLHPFMPILSNSVASTLSLPSIDATTIDTPATIYGTSIQYRGDSYSSDEGYDFNLEFRDNKQLEVYYLFKMWDEYERLKKLGIVTPPNLNEGIDTGYYRVNRILHDQIAIYRFLVDENDMSSIIHYSKLIGCFPKSVPRDSFDTLSGEIKYSIAWHAQWVYDSDPIILYEFNQTCNNYFGGNPPSDTNYIELYNKEIEAVDGSWRPHPYVIQVKKANKNKPGTNYKLAWFNR